MRKVHPGNIHSILDELQQDLRRPADWSNGADNAGQPHLVGRGVHVQVGDILNVGGALPGSLLTWLDIALLQDRLNKINNEHLKML